MDFPEYDTSGIAKPGTVAQRLLAAGEDDFHSLAISDCFDLEGGDERQFEAALAALHADFETVARKLSKDYGAPAFSGTDKDDDFPAWAGTGYRVACWNRDGRIVYLHITHVDPIAPLELTLGVVTGPPKHWSVGM